MPLLAGLKLDCFNHDNSKNVESRERKTDQRVVYQSTYLYVTCTAFTLLPESVSQGLGSRANVTSSVISAAEGISRHLCVQVSTDSAHLCVSNIRGSETFSCSSSEFIEKYNHNFFYMGSKAAHISLLVLWRHAKRKEADILQGGILFKWLMNDSLFLQVDFLLEQGLCPFCFWTFILL